MANRVDANEVKEIIDTALGESTIEAFITAANVIVTSLLGSSGLGTAHLKEIERWLTAHLISCARDRTVRTEQAGQASITYETQPLGKGLDASLYGQQVKLLDTTGILAAEIGAAALKSASIYAITSFDTDVES